VRNIENLWAKSTSRRNAFRSLAGFLAASPLLRGQQDPFRDHSRVPGLNELTNAFDFEAVARSEERFSRNAEIDYDFDRPRLENVGDDYAHHRDQRKRQSFPVRTNEVTDPQLA